jgi:dihydroxyacetone kinase
MKKLINAPANFVDEFVEGILLAHPDLVKTPADDVRVMVRADAPVAGKVGIVTGGGAGHLPLFKGYVGTGLCSGVRSAMCSAPRALTKSSRQRRPSTEVPASCTCTGTTAVTS